jgi:peroxiredoxin Q/BCP
MKTVILGFVLAAAWTAPAFADLKVGDTAPDFTATASLGGMDSTFNLYEALKQGPAVIYFYPSAYTQGCDLEAHTFAENADKFDAAGTRIIGVSADNLGRLNQFSADPNFCAGKFSIASDESLNIAKSYDLKVNGARAGAKDVRGAEIGHGFIERVTFVVGENHKILAVMSSNDDQLTPDQHVDKSLEIVQKIKMAGTPPSPMFARTVNEYLAACITNESDCMDKVGSALMDRYQFSGDICLPSIDYGIPVPGWLGAHPETHDMPTENGIYLALKSLYRCG